MLYLEIPPDRWAATLAKLNNVVLVGMDGYRLQKVGVVSHSVKWCVVPGPTGLAGADSHRPGGLGRGWYRGLRGFRGQFPTGLVVEQIKSRAHKTGEPTVG